MKAQRECTTCNEVVATFSTLCGQYTFSLVIVRTVSHNMLLPPLPYLVHSTTDGALIRCALVSASVAFLLLTLLIAGIIIGFVLFRRVKGIVLEKEGKLVRK